MKLHHARNATLIIEAGQHVIVVDPFLSKPHTQPPFTLFRFKPTKNPLVPFPESSRAIMDRVTHCLVTHKHPDHIDKDAINFLIQKKIPVTCSELDEALFKKKGLDVVQTLAYWKKQDFLGGSIVGVPARHGYGFVARIAGNVMGFHLELPGSPSLYISSDTIYTDNVHKALKEFQPAITVVACGTAQLDFGQPLLMTLDDIVKFVQNSPGKVVANHMEALNHCPTTRQELKERLSKEELIDKVFIPDDGIEISFD